MLQGKTILIVGAAQGIGKATAELCAQHGANMVVADFNEDAVAGVAKSIGAKSIKVNVADEISVKSMFGQIEKLDALINTAGVMLGSFVPLEELSAETFRQTFEINTLGSFLIAKHAAPLLRKGNKPVIVLVSSIAATAGSSSYAYGTSKGGVTSLGVTLANKLAPDGIRVNVVAPGNIDTAMKRTVIQAEAERVGPGEQARFDLGEPLGVAKVLAWLVSDDADYVRGALFTR
jgi:NAD(P)-dependent dehydrogenase (short-subunit alcohol dehydrogenase family)